ncbi:MAG: hypothetical protein ACLTXH_05055 [Enterobacter hormaechei]
MKSLTAGGMRYIGTSYGDAKNTFAPSVDLYDAMPRYDLGERTAA